LGFFGWAWRRQSSEEADDAYSDQTQKIAASKDNPQYTVQSDKSGKVAAHKSDELKKA
jgi:hypothetical protein